MPDFKVLIETVGAWFRAHKNEVSLDGKKSFEDPVKFRGGTFYPTGYYVIVSGDRLSGDEADPTRHERGYFGLRHNDDYPKAVDATEFIIFMQDGGGTEDQTMRLRLRLTTEYLEVNGRRIGAGESGGGISKPTFYIESPDGHWRTQIQQEDGNLVTYDMWAPAGPKAVWASGVPYA